MPQSNSAPSDTRPRGSARATHATAYRAPRKMGREQKRDEMKHLLSFLAGSLVTTSAVVFAGGPGMVALGGILTVTLLLACIWALGIPRVFRWLLAFHSANSENFSAATQWIEDPPSAPGRRKNHTTEKTGNVVSFQKPGTVLNPTQQQVVSALHNLGMPMSKAERIVIEASQGRPGMNFDSLFRACVAPPKTANA